MAKDYTDLVQLFVLVGRKILPSSYIEMRLRFSLKPEGMVDTV
ncbi:hypothetical protein ACVRY0_06980 [Streptococcus intermedius]|nr:hypothetical protein [Streptococcus intermedius]RSJ17206.1 hypothetical protein D8830_07125 [Streptococcus intermedius]RSJ23939.1 hypothetical protein D8828_02360 [Streptococcus intermedius]